MAMGGDFEIERLGIHKLGKIRHEVTKRDFAVLHIHTNLTVIGQTCDMTILRKSGIRRLNEWYSSLWLAGWLRDAYKAGSQT